MEKIVISDDNNTVELDGEKLVFKPISGMSCQGCRFFGDMKNNCVSLMIPCADRADGKIGIFMRAID